MSNKKTQPFKEHPQKQAMVQALEKTLGIITKASKMSGVSRKSHYRWMEDDEEYKEVVDSIADIALDYVEDKMFEQIDMGNPPLIMMYLKTKGKKRGYIEKTEVESNVTVTGNPVISFGDTSKKEDNTEDDNE